MTLCSSSIYCDGLLTTTRIQIRRNRVGFSFFEFSKRLLLTSKQLILKIKFAQNFVSLFEV